MVRGVFAWLPILAAAVSSAGDNPLVGIWSPYSRAYQVLGPLTINKETLTWDECKEVPYSLIDDRESQTYPGPTAFKSLSKAPKWRAITIKIDASTCDGRVAREPYILFVIPLEAEKLGTHIVTYRSPEDYKEGGDDGFFGWGIINKEK